MSELLFTRVFSLFYFRQGHLHSKGDAGGEAGPAHTAELGAAGPRGGPADALRSRRDGGVNGVNKFDKV